MVRGTAAGLPRKGLLAIGGALVTVEERLGGGVNQETIEKDGCATLVPEHSSFQCISHLDIYLSLIHI